MTEPDSLAVEKAAADLLRRASRTAEALILTAAGTADALEKGKAPSRWDRPITITRKQAFLFLVALAVSITLDLGIASADVLINNSNSHTQHSLRLTQVASIKAARAQCELDRKRADGQRAYQQFILQTQKDGLEQIKHIPSFNTPEIRALALANQQKQIDATNALLASYLIGDCNAFRPPK